MQRSYMSLMMVLAFMGGSAAHAETHLQHTVQAVGAVEPVVEAANSKWAYQAGAFVGSVPKYEGSDKSHIVAAPIGNISYDEGAFFAGAQGIGGRAIQYENLEVTGAISYDGGRKEKDDRKNLKGMGTVKSSVTSVVSADYTLEPVVLNMTATNGLSGDYGSTVEMGVSTRYPVTEEASLLAGVTTQWADDKHMDRYFGVSAKQAAASGKKKFSAGSGFDKVSANIGVQYQVTPSIGVLGSVEVGKLMGDAADSPLSVDDTQTKTMLGMLYSF